MAEGVLERVVQHRSANVEKGLHSRSVPAHLLFLVHALCNDLINRTLTNAVEIGSPRRRLAA